MSDILVYDLFKELKLENQRLLTELKFSIKLNEILENYRNYLLKSEINCKCVESLNRKLLIDLLEKDYKNLFQFVPRHQNSVEEHNRQNGENSHLFRNQTSNATPLPDQRTGHSVKEEPNSSATSLMSNECQKIDNNLNDNRINVKTESIAEELIEFSCEEIKELNEDLVDEDVDNQSNDGIETKHLLSQFAQSMVELAQTSDPTNERSSDQLNRNSNQFKSDINECNESFDCQQSLSARQRIHMPSNPYNRRRVKIATSGANSSRLVDKPYTVRTYECDFGDCKQIFTNWYYLFRHKKWKHNQIQYGLPDTGQQRQFRCELPGCRSSFNCLTQLEAHLNRHRGVRPYKCPFDGCPYSYCNPNGLVRHQKRCPKKHLLGTDLKPLKSEN